MNVGVGMISGFNREVDDNSTVLGYYAASNGNTLRTFRDDLSVSSSRNKMRPGCPETSAMNCHYSLRNNPEERSSS